MALTRRALIEQIGRVGGAGAAYAAIEMLGLTPTVKSEAQPAKKSNQPKS